MVTSLEVCLRGGIRVKQILHSDHRHVPQQVAAHRVPLPQQRYFHPLTAAALESMWLLPHEHWNRWMFAALFECKDMNSAGAGSDLQGKRSGLCFHILR